MLEFNPMLGNLLDAFSGTTQGPAAQYCSMLKNLHADKFSSSELGTGAWCVESLICAGEDTSG